MIENWHVHQMNHRQRQQQLEAQAEAHRQLQKLQAEQTQNNELLVRLGRWMEETGRRIQAENTGATGNLA